MKKIFVLTLALLLLLSACGNAETPSVTEPQETVAEAVTTEAPETESPETEAPETEAPETEPAETEPEDLDDEELRYDVISVELVCGSGSVMLKNSEINTVLDALSKFDFVESDAVGMPLGPVPCLKITTDEGVTDIDMSMGSGGNIGNCCVFQVYPLNEPHTIEGRTNSKYYDLYDQFEALDDETRETILSYINRAYDLTEHFVRPGQSDN